MRTAVMLGLFISSPRGGQVYVAHRSSRSAKLIWYALPYEPTAKSSMPRHVRTVKLGVSSEAAVRFGSSARRK